jgi:hypothetical protein
MKRLQLCLQFQLAPLHRGGAEEPRLLDELHGEALQVDGMKPVLKAPGTKCLKLKYGEVLSGFAFDIIFCRYVMVMARKVTAIKAEGATGRAAAGGRGGAHA